MPRRELMNGSISLGMLILFFICFMSTFAYSTKYRYTSMSFDNVVNPKEDNFLSLALLLWKQTLGCMHAHRLNCTLLRMLETLHKNMEAIQFTNNSQPKNIGRKDVSGLSVLPNLCSCYFVFAWLWKSSQFLHYAVICEQS
ncbi:hypothetical protein TEA_024897 [Camellia sinensis var. sinensis]|uniref:Uncharacterized protein n=1 Tax=Camellia sinensis var. sinensis TaxID=542762 RepID=A0A4S4DK21_CAMSN|nr:hypothetical protein TEA_024897 [Camellia sinensis var. sinensis]